MDPWTRFTTAARGEPTDRAPVALIVDSPWLPSFAGLDTLDYFLRPDLWLKTNLALLERFPEVTWLPGFWVEYGMAAEPSAFGARVVWHHDRPPSIDPVRGGLASLAGIEPANPQEHGMMPLALRLYEDAARRLAAEGLQVRMVAARGPLAVAVWLLGVSELMVALKREPDAAHALLDTLTETSIRWLRAQAEAVGGVSGADGVEGILLLDDIPGMLSPKMFDAMAAPYLARILDAFDGLVRVYHNDTPCEHLLPKLGALPFEVWNFSHETDIAAVQAALPDKTLLGNVPPLRVLAQGTPDEVYRHARACIEKTGGRRLVLSAGGGTNAGTPPENIDALVRAARG
ncbi:MAG: uroporphyrinogen decarboxylase family protein [Anaerolineae bacterium]|jgi:uroporphyrinogen decarboxylase|nr:uroporphyrinogen decarboxylase family protein [Anaerolineae bacterium]